MIKKEIYPKTERLKCEGEKVYVTEKLDGSNMVFFKLDNELYIAQRKNIFKLSELDEVKGVLYQGLYEWLKDYGSILEGSINEGSAICGEWLGMGKIKYTIDEFDKRWYMFAKANINTDLKLYNLIYNHDLFKYSFVNESMPAFLGIVPEVDELDYLPKKVNLDKIYESYVNKKGRSVEGFVVNYKNLICKYVRMKNGKLREHFDYEDKE